MNKAELIAAVAEHAEIDRKTVAKVLDSLTDVIPLAVAIGEKISILGFGTFEAAYRPARTGRNPQTGEPLNIAESWTPKFTAGGTFKGLVKDSKSKALPAAQL